MVRNVPPTEARREAFIEEVWEQSKKTVDGPIT